MRARARREQATAARAEIAEREARAERTRPERPRGRYRGAPVASGTYAIGDPSASLERAAAAERGYVVKDFGRLGKVIVAMLVLLVLSGFVVSNVVK